MQRLTTDRFNGDIHTDALGSPVARSGAAGKLVSRTSYEPYGATASGVTPSIGFTGHVNDARSGLVYMQQRHFDPVTGRFLSIDPVTADANTGSNFHRYAYAANNPYKYVDPDGRNAALAGQAAIGDTFACGPVCGVIAGEAVLVGGTYITAKIVNLMRASDANTTPGVGTGDAPKSGSSAGLSSSLPKLPTGPGSVPKADRDPQRFVTPGDREAKREEQGHKCGNDCGTDIDQSNSAGHHSETRHADGGKTIPENHAEVCKDRP